MALYHEIKQKCVSMVPCQMHPNLFMAVGPAAVLTYLQNGLTDRWEASREAS